MAASELDRFWELANRTRDTRPFLRSGAGIVQFATEHDIRLTPSDLWSLTARFGEGACPPSIASFIVRLLDGVKAQRVLDPHVGFGTLLQPVIAATRASDFVGTSPHEGALEVAEYVHPTEAGGEYRVCDLEGEGLARLGEFDLVVSLPPFGLRPREFTIDGVTVRDEGGHELLLRSSLRLSAKGLAIFVVAPRFHFAANERSVVRRLADFGLYLDASFHAAGGAFMPLTSIAADIVVIRRGNAATALFAGQATEQARPLKALLSNYQHRRLGPTPELGVLVPHAAYRGFEAESSKHRIATLTKRLNLARRDLDYYALEIIRCPGHRGDIEYRDNGFFLPLIVTSRCRTDAAELPERPNDFVQIVVDPEKADSNVVAGFFDSPLGREIRASYASGITIRRVPRGAVGQLPVWLPDVKEQRTLVELDQRLRAISSEANELHGRLWEGLNRTDEVRRRLEQLNRDDTFPAWLDTLPFPLASILWTHHTLKGRPLKRYHQLEFFFEGLVEFLGIWLMSGVKTSPDLFETEWNSIRQTLDGAGLSVERASFGTWVTIVERLAKMVRSGVTSKVEERRYWEARFACDSPELLQSLVSKPMVALARKANTLRNDWRGHGGVVGDTEAGRRESVLLGLLADFRDLVGHRWEDYPLVFPNLLRLSSGVFRCNVFSVTGVRYPFDQRQLDLKAPLEDGWLHFVSPLTGAVCPVLPLVRLGATATEERNACYFFNRLEGRDSQRYVSYHFEDRPDVVEEIPAASELLRELSRQDRSRFRVPDVGGL